MERMDEKGKEWKGGWDWISSPMLEIKRTGVIDVGIGMYITRRSPYIGAPGFMY